MRRLGLLLTLALISSAAGGLYYLKHHANPTTPPTMEPDGAAISDGILVQKKTVDWEALLKSAVQQNAKFLTVTLKEDKIRDQEIETVIKYTHLPPSRARVRVKYHAEYPVGYNLELGTFRIDGSGNDLVLVLHRPEIIAKPSSKLLSYEILDSGFLVDEKQALLDLQQRIQPEVESRASQVLRRADITPLSERALRGFLQTFLVRNGEGQTPPNIKFVYQ